MAELRTFSFIDTLQPQVASFQATISGGYLPIEGQASLFIEISPGIEINSITDVALKQTDVKPGMQIVERRYGVLEIHHNDQGEVRAAGEAILNHMGLNETDRMKPTIVSSEAITGIDPHQAMLINRMRHGDMINDGQTMLVVETNPAGYVLLAANEAEKASPIKIMEIRAFGAFGRLHIAGWEEEINEAMKAISLVLENIEGQVQVKK